MNVRLPRGTVHATEDGHKTVCGWPIPPDAPEEPDAALTCTQCSRRRAYRGLSPTGICPNCGNTMWKGAKLCRACAYPDRQQFVPVSGKAKAELGCIVSFENADGKTWSVHQVGYIKQAIGAACDAALRLDETFRVTAISTPTSIYTDMQGARSSSGRETDQIRSSSSQLPEASLLGMAGRREMLHPRYVR